MNILQVLFSSDSSKSTLSKNLWEHSALSSHFCKSKTCEDDSAQTLLLPIPHHTLRSFNYLMQDAGIMLGHHLKEAPAFICWDGSSMWREDRGLLEYHEHVILFKGHLSMSLSPSVFILFLAASPQSTLHCHVFFLFLWRYAGPKELSSQRQSWQVNLRWNHNSNFTFYCLVFTGLHPRDLMYCSVSHVHIKMTLCV